MPEQNLILPDEPDVNIQNLFIERLKQVLPPGIGMAEEIADILNISVVSAYRRIRGETGLTLKEIYRIGKLYAISIDEIFRNRSDSVTFTYTRLTDSAKNFEEYLLRLTNNMKTINRFANRKIYYVAEEIPLFYSFYSPKFADFKLFYWQRSVLNCPEYQQSKYVPGLMPDSLVEIAQQCYNEYITIPSVEVWTDLTVFTGLRQIGFYFESGIVTKECALELLAEYRRTIEHVQLNAEMARKNASDSTETFTMYNSEVVLGTNSIYTTMGDAKYAYISFNTLNSLTTFNSEFCMEMEHWMRNLERKSTLISGVGEKQRYQFFSSMYKKIDDFIKNVEDSSL